MAKFAKRPDGTTSTAVLPVTNLRSPVWEQQNNEKYQQFNRFQLYRDMGAERTFVAVGLEVGRDRSIIEDQAARWRWKERADAWDRHLDAIRIKAIEEASRTMSSRQAKLGMLLQDKATSALEMLTFDNDNMPSAKDVVQLAEAGVKIERLARGEKTEDAPQITIQLPVLPTWAKGSQFIKLESEDSNGNVESAVIDAEGEIVPA